MMYGWLKALPDDAVRRSPVLSVFYGSMLMASGDLDGGRAPTRRRGTRAGGRTRRRGAALGGNRRPPDAAVHHRHVPGRARPGPR